jgi:ubiquinone/menaquinone biosynthesis C-methylase UbiE
MTLGIDYLRWMLSEFTGVSSTSAIYDEVAKDNSYDDIVGYASRVAGFRKAFDLLARQPKSVLDIACGTGAAIDALANKKSAKIVGIDLSENMLQIAMERFKGYKNIRLKQEDFLKVSCSAGSFDLIILANAARFIPKNKEQEFAKSISKWLTKDGVFLLFDMDDPVTLVKDVMLRPLGLPRGYNPDMNTSDYFVKVMSKILVLDKKVEVNKQRMFYKTSAFFFRKKGDPEASSG